MQLEHVNLRGDVRRGWIMKPADEAGAQAPISSERTQIKPASLLHVALGEDGLPRPVPSLNPETELEARRMAAGKERQAYRLAQREQDQERPAA